MKRIFLDSDILLDAVLKRPEFMLPALNLLALAHDSRFELMTSSVAFVNTHYFLNKFDKANKFVLLKRLRTAISIINVDETIIDQALKNGADDFEDTVQYYAARKSDVDFIITRNIKDYKQADIPVLTAEDFLRTIL